MDTNKLRELAGTINGWLSPGEGELLYNLARKCQGLGAVVEIGSWMGKSTVWLASGCKAGQQLPLFAVDPHAGALEHHMTGVINTLDKFNENLRKAGVEDLVTPIVKTSGEAAKTFSQPIELLFIDGSHEYDSATRDCELWLPKVVPGGTVAIHDTTTYDGPRKAVTENMLTSDQFRASDNVESITFATKVERNSLADRLRNRYTRLSIDTKFWGRQVARYLWSARSRT